MSMCLEARKEVQEGPGIPRNRLELQEFLGFLRMILHYEEYKGPWGSSSRFLLAASAPI